MICKKCGTELNKSYDFCPKCGNRLKKKFNVGVWIGIILLIMISGIGAVLYVSGYYKVIVAGFGKSVGEPVTELADRQEEDAGTVSSDVEKLQEIEEEEGAERVTEESDEEFELFLSNLTFEPIEMTMGETYQVELESEVKDKDMSWQSSDEKVVKALEGELKAMMPGTATVTLVINESEIPIDVTVNNFPDMTLAVNCSKSLELNDAFLDIRWESSAPEYVSVEEGKITSLAAGASTITAYIDEVSYSFEVVATTPDITATSVRKIIGNTEQVSILGTNGKAEWKSDNTAIATVSDTGLITAEPTGAGQSTVVHAYVDGMEFKIDVAVEPIPQLSSTYKMYGHQNNSTYKNARVTICTNANETITYTGKAYDSGVGGYVHEESENVLKVAYVDYSNGEIYPVYHAFYSYYDTPDDENHTDIYLVGTSQIAEVLAQKLDYYYDDDIGLCSNLSKATSVVTYEPCENYGVIHIYDHDTFVGWGTNQKLLITVLVDEYKYQFVIAAPVGSSVSNAGRFDYKNIDKFPPDYMIEECSVDEIIVHEKVNVNYSALQANSRTYNPDTEWVERIGTKFVEAVEDQAIEMAAGALLKMIFI